MRAGYVYLVWCTWARPQKNKYVICVSPTDNLFLLINSREPRNSQAGVQVTRRELPGLQYDSFVDTSQFVRFYDVEAAVQREPRRQVGNCGAGLRRRIKTCVEGHDLLTPRQKRLIQENL